MSTKIRTVLLLIIVFLSCIFCVGGILFVLLRPSKKPEATYHFTWSPQGDLVAFECVFYPFEEKKKQWRDPFDPYFDFSSREICVADLSKKEYYRLSPWQLGRIPSWAPNGNKLAWYSFPSSIHVWDKNRGKIMVYPYPDLPGDFPSWEGNDGLAWSIDGDIIFLQGPGLMLDLASGSYKQQDHITNNLEQCCFTWSPNAKLLAFHADDRMVVYEDNSMVFERGASNIDQKYWSPDSENLAWYTGGISYEKTELAITNIHTQTTHYFDKNPVSHVSNSAWSLDGDLIAVEGFNEIYIISFSLNKENSSIEVINNQEFETPDIHIHSSISISPNGRLIAYDTWDYSIAIIDIFGDRYSINDLLPSLSSEPSEMFIER